MGFFSKTVDKMINEKVPLKKRKKLIIFVTVVTLQRMHGLK